MTNDVTLSVGEADVSLSDISIDKSCPPSGREYESLFMNSFSGEFTIESSDDVTDDSIDALKKYLADCMSNLSVMSGRSHGKRYMHSRLAFGESAIARMNEGYLDLGDHRIIESECGTGLTFECSNCDWDAALSTDRLDAAEVRGLKAYIYGEALDAACVHNDSEDKTDEIAGIPVLTSDTSKSNVVGYMADGTAMDGDTVSMVGYDPARQS